MLYPDRASVLFTGSALLSDSAQRAYDHIQCAPRYEHGPKTKPKPIRRVALALAHIPIATQGCRPRGRPSCAARGDVTRSRRMADLSTPAESPVAGLSIAPFFSGIEVQQHRRSLRRCLRCLRAARCHRRLLHLFFRLP